MCEVKKEFFSGVLVTAIAKYSSIIISLVVTSVLSRILVPDDFGVVAIASFFINFFSTLTVSGFGPAIIQNKELSTRDISSIFTLTIYLGLILSGCFFLVAGEIAHYYNDIDSLYNICKILSINVLFAIVNIVPNALLFKQKLFKFVAVRTIIVQITIGVIAIISAYNGAGVYALLVNPVVGSVVIFFITYSKAFVKPSPFVYKDSINKVLGFSIYQLLFNFVYLLYRGVDKVLLGRYFGMSVLGYYEKSYRLMMLPLENISNVINPVLHPILSEHQKNTDFIYNAYLKMVKLLSEIGFLITVFLFFNAHELIILLFGEQWIDSVEVFKILSLSVAFQIIQSPIAGVFQTLNKVKGLFYASLVALLMVVISIGVGVWYDSLVLFAICLTVSFGVMFVVYNLFLKILAGFSLKGILYTMVKPILISLPLSITLLWVSETVDFHNSLVISFVTKSFICTIYTIALITMGFFESLPIPPKLRLWKKL